LVILYRRVSSIRAVLWTVLKTKEYPPKEFNEYNGINEENEKGKSGKKIWELIIEAPKVFWQLGFVQFFSWFALFLMWVYTTPAIAEHIWGPNSTDPSSKGYNEAANWSGVIFGFYSVVAAVYAYLIPSIVKAMGRKKTYTFSLFLGGIGFITMLLVQDKYLLFVSMLGIGAAWAAILAMPYAMLAESLPAKSMGAYMGLFNASITLPQIAAGLFGGIILKQIGGSPIMMLVIAGVSMLIAGLGVVFIKEKTTNH
jgi:maltose/moltooligosaccharide transporter